MTDSPFPVVSAAGSVDCVSARSHFPGEINWAKLPLMPELPLALTISLAIATVPAQAQVNAPLTFDLQPTAESTQIAFTSAPTTRPQPHDDRAHSLKTDRQTYSRPVQTILNQPNSSEPSSVLKRPVELGFTLSQPTEQLPKIADASHTPTASSEVFSVEVSNVNALFEGGSNSLVARTIGSAEGTRTASGDRTWAYYGHRDPGNGVWNLGSFSYQHGANSPQAADVKQQRRLKRQLQILQSKASKYGIMLSLEETLNGLDLANQSPSAALSRGGYIDRLAQTRKRGIIGTEAILWARTRSFLDPDTNRWNASGLGNSGPRITRDQSRRMRAIRRAIVSYTQQKGFPDIAAVNSDRTSSFPRTTQPLQFSSSLPQDAIAEQIIHLDLSGSR